MQRYGSLCFIAPLNKDKALVYKLKQSIQVFPAASNSTILALASYILWTHPHLLPYEAGNDFKCQKIQGIQRQKSFPSPYLSLHPYFQIWSDALCKAVLEGDAKRQSQTLYIGLKVSQEYLQKLKKEEWSIQIFQRDVLIEQIFNLKNLQESEKRIAICNLGVSQLRKDKLQPKINIAALILGTIFKNEKWKLYCVLKNQIPTEQEFAKLDSIILPGSTHSVNDDVPQINRLLRKLKSALKKNDKLRVLGICFGHQLISKLKKVPIQARKHIKGLENIQFDNTIIKNYKFLQPLEKFYLKKALLSEFHQDYVEKVPRNFHLLGKSKSCKVQALLSKNGRILSFQSHPEYFSQYTTSYFYRTQRYSKDYIPDSGLQFQYENMDKHHESSETIRECMSLFLRHQK